MTTQTVEELEAKNKELEEELAVERDRSSRARKKARQLLLKIQERDAKLAELQEALEKAQAQVQAQADELERVQAQANNASSSQKQRHRRREPKQSAKTRERRLTKRDLAIQERSEIVLQLEGHLKQMRANLLESEREVHELEERKRVKEVEWNNTPDANRTPDVTQAHWQAAGMIGQQIVEKRNFSAELTQKTRELEDQVAQQQRLIDELLNGGRGSSSSHGEDGELPDSSDEVACQDEALAAFLAAAGSAAQVIKSRRPLLAGFEQQPPHLTAEAIDGCSTEDRATVLSLFVAWAAVAGEEPRAVHMSDIGLELTDACTLEGTLQSCNAQLEEWEMTRCPASEASVRVLFRSLGTQPLRRLNLSYNALGPVGAGVLVGVATSWAPSLEQLSLEMNGLGDSGCEAVAGALECGLFPYLQTLELGWNELTSTCAKGLAALLTEWSAPADAAGSPEGAVPRLRKLGLGGNRLGSEGAQALVNAALVHAERDLELDLSMNHVGSAAVSAVADWAEASLRESSVSISINLEWNMIDDTAVVKHLMQTATSAVKDADPRFQRPLVRLGNNELDLSPSEVLEQSHGVVSF